MKQWCTNNNMVITNTMFPKHPENRVTFVGPNGRPRQLDYILVPKAFIHMVQDSGSSKLLQMGSDHNAVMTKFKLRPARRRSKKPQKHKPKRVCWAGIAADQYVDTLTSKLADAELDVELSQKCDVIERLMAEAAMEASQPAGDDGNNFERKKLCALVEERHRLGSSQTGERKCLSKAIKREIKAVRNLESEAKINTIISNLKGFSNIIGTKTCQKKTMITHMTDDSGHDKTDRQAIADIFAEFYSKLYSSQVEKQER